MLSQLLLLAGASIYGVLGTSHLVFTFFTDHFKARDPTVVAAMQGTAPRLTKATTMWKAWIGFNASHSLGAMLFAAVYLLLALGHMDVLAASPSLLILAVVTSLAYLVLAWRYWFAIPLVGILIATLCFGLATVLLVG